MLLLLYFVVFVVVIVGAKQQRALTFDESISYAKSVCSMIESEEQCVAADCNWMPLRKGVFYCTKNFKLDRLSDSEAHAIENDDSVRAWGEQNCACYGWRAREGILPLVFDAFIFYNEFELLELRLNELDGVVDFHILVEGDRTFTNRAKPLLFAEHADEFSPWHERILYHEPCALNAASNDYKSNWAREHEQRACLERVIREVAEESDVVVLADVDEVPRREVLMALKACDVDKHLDADGIALVLRQYAHTFYQELTSMVSPWPGYNNWPGPVAISARRLLEEHTTAVRFSRENPSKTPRIVDAGWHFSPFAFHSTARLQDKLDSWAHQEEHRKQDAYRQRLMAPIEEGRCDYCRTLNTDEDYRALPLYVRDHHRKYASLLLPRDKK